MKTMRGYQRTAFERFKDALFFCLNLDCGLGKTFVAALIALYKKMPTIIIAPNSLCEQWRDELVELGVDEKDIFIANAPREHKDPAGYWADYETWIKE